MYFNGEQLTADQHFLDHIEHHIPVQVYFQDKHTDIGYIDDFDNRFIKMNQAFYNRSVYTFRSRPGY